MAWKPQGGGPWGGGGQGPWGSGGGRPGGGGQGQPDIEEMLRRSQDSFKKMMPGGFGSGKGISLAILAALALWMASGFYRVDAGRQGVVLLFGEFVQTTMPGLHWYFPAPIGTVITPDVEQVRRIDIGFRSAGDQRSVFGRAPVSGRDVLEESLMLTGDQNIADVDFSVQWKVKDASRFLFNIRDPENTVKLAAESSMREVIGQTTLQEAMTSGRQQIADGTRRLLQDILDSYGAGITITQVQLLKVDPPEKVIDAFNEVQRARQDKERKQNEAETYRNKIIPTARGEAEKMVQAATAYKERVIMEAEGEAKQFISVYETYKSAKDVTTQRLYIEAMEEILRGSNKVIIDADGKSSGVVPYLPLPELQKKSQSGGNAK